jgi:23S rRNA pseudouridine2605 synthase
VDSTTRRGAGRRGRRRRGPQGPDEERREREDDRAAEGAPTGGPERLQKLLARAGYGSRRRCEELITAGLVTVDGKVARELGSKADPAAQAITVEGKPLRAEPPAYYLLNKPKGVLCTSRDPQGRRTVIDLLPGHERRRLFAVGRLDAESRGAVILTNDGAFTNLLTHPRYGIEKTYLLRIRGHVSDGAVERLRQGVWLSEGRTLPARVWIIKRKDDETEMGIAICEGKNRQVRRMLVTVGHKVLGLTRTRIGPLTLRGVGDGQVRALTAAEVDELRRIAQKNAQAPLTKPEGRRSRTRSPGKPDPATAQRQVYEAPRDEAPGAGGGHDDDHDEEDLA